jgi:hypothetical protein
MSVEIRDTVILVIYAVSTAYLHKPRALIKLPFTEGESESSYYLIYSMLLCITKGLTFTVYKQLYVPRTSSVWLR